MSGPGRSALQRRRLGASSGTQLEERSRRRRRGARSADPASGPSAGTERLGCRAGSCRARRPCPSAGPPAGRRSIAATASLNQALCPSTTRSRPARSSPILHFLVAERRAARCATTCASAVRRPRGRASHREPGVRAPARAIASRHPGRSAPRAAPSRAPPARSAPISVGVDIRRVRDDEVERPFEQPGEELAVDELDRRGPVRATFSRPAPARPTSCRSRRPARPGARRRSRARSRRSPCRRRAPAAPRVRAAARGSARRRTSVSGRGTRTRGSTAQRQPPEPPLAEHVRERLAPRPPRDERPADGALRSAGASVAVSCRARARDSPSACASSRSASTRGDGTSALARASPRRGERVAQRQRHGHASSARRRSSAASASVNSSSSPSRIASSRCAVSLIRWSVTPVLGEVVGADLLGALAASRSASGGSPRAPPAACSRSRLVEPRAEDAHRLLPCSGAATSRPASRRRARSAGA